MTDRELDRMMQHVLLDAIKRDCEKETDGVPAFKPTRHYQRQIAAMLSDPLKWAQKRARPLWKNVAQKIAVILLVFSLSLGSLMAVSPTVRAAVVRWVTEWYETHVVYRFSGEQIADEMPQYEVTDLPEGYAETERVEWPSYVSIIYQNVNDENGNVKKCAVGKHPKSEKLGSTGQAACCARIHSRYFTGGSPSGLRV